MRLLTHFREHLFINADPYACVGFTSSTSSSCNAAHKAYTTTTCLYPLFNESRLLLLVLKSSDLYVCFPIHKLEVALVSKYYAWPLIKRPIFSVKTLFVSNFFVFFWQKLVFCLWVRFESKLYQTVNNCWFICNRFTPWI